jgi:hypothetical protein
MLRTGVAERIGSHAEFSRRAEPEKYSRFALGQEEALMSLD